jgi:hypothetical protein
MKIFFDFTQEYGEQINRIQPFPVQVRLRFGLSGKTYVK